MIIWSKNWRLSKNRSIRGDHSYRHPAAKMFGKSLTFWICGRMLMKCTSIQSITYSPPTSHWNLYSSALQNKLIRYQCRDIYRRHHTMINVNESLLAQLWLYSAYVYTSIRRTSDSSFPSTITKLSSKSAEYSICQKWSVSSFPVNGSNRFFSPQKGLQTFCNLFGNVLRPGDAGYVRRDANLECSQ